MLIYIIHFLIYCLAFPKSQTDNMSPSDYADMLENCTGTPWSHCHNCKQEYQGDLRRNLAEMWLDAVENNDDSDPQHEIAMLNFAEACMKINAYDLAIQICDNIRAIVKLKFRVMDVMLVATFPTPPKISSTLSFNIAISLLLLLLLLSSMGLRPIVLARSLTSLLPTLGCGDRLCW